MKIAFNCCYYGRTSGGIKQYIYNLVTNLYKIDKKNEYIFYVSIDDLDYWNETMPPGVKCKKFPFRRTQKIRRALFQNKFWKKEQKKEKFTLFFSPFFNIPNIKDCIKIMTVHDLRLKRYPKSYTLSRRLFLNYYVKKSVKDCDKIITISHFTKNELINFYNCDKNKIVTIYEAINNEEFKLNSIPKKKDLKHLKLASEKFILTVGHLEPRKNYGILIEAFNELIYEKDLNYKLVIVGKKNFKYKRILEKIKHSKNVLHLGFVEFSDLLKLYYFADLFVFPSIYEGFGFPPLEAASLGTPSVVSKASCIPEICGDSALYFNPFDKSDLKKNIFRILNDKNFYEKYKNLAKKNMKRFSWKTNAKKTSNLFNKMYKKFKEKNEI